MEFETGRICNIGGRKSNQDYAGSMILDRMACWVVADGLGGHMGGEVASKAAVETILATFKKNPACSPEALKHYLDAAQAEVLRLQAENPRLSRMRTTIVVVLSDFKHFLWGHVGDARFYLLRGGEIDLKTRDHSVPQAMVNAGDITFDQIRNHEDRNRLVRSLGQPESFRPEICKEMAPLEHGDVFLLCTDGFWEYVIEEEMEVDFVKAKDSRQWLQLMESRIHRRAHGEFDNYTAVAVFLNAPEIKKQVRSQKASNDGGESIVRKPAYPGTPALHSEHTRTHKRPKPGIPGHILGRVLSLVSLKAWLIVAVILLSFLTGGFVMKWTFKDALPKTVEKPQSPADMKRNNTIYVTGLNQSFKSLDKALKKAKKGQRIWLSRGYFYTEPKNLINKEFIFTGAGIEASCLFVTVKYPFPRNLIFDFLNPYLVEFCDTVLLGVMSSRLSELRLILIDEKMKIRNCFPEIKEPQKRKKLQNILKKRKANSEKTPFHIQRITLQNVKRAGTVLSSASARFKKNDIRFISFSASLKIENWVKRNVDGKIGVKFINPEGELIKNPSSSPSSYTFYVPIKVPGDKVLKGAWGNEHISHFSVGTHRIQLWWKGEMILETPFDVIE